MIWILANPTAGSGRARRFAEKAALLLQDHGQSIELHYTHQKGHGRQIAEQAVSEEVPILAVCGGDGTVGEALPALVGHTTALGLLPFGTANDLARALGIPRDLRRAVRCLVEGQSTPIDLGRMGDRYFSTVAAFGFDAEVSAAMAAGRAPFSGTPGYIAQSLRHLRHYQPPIAQLRGAFGQLEQPVFLVASGNTRSYGGGMCIAPHATPHDALFDVCIVEPLSYLQALALLPQVFSGRHIRHPAVRVERTHFLEIGGEAGRLLFADGEYCGQTPLVLEVAPAAVRAILPAL